MESSAGADEAFQELLGRPSGSPPLAALRIRPARAAELVASTAGEVTRSQTLDGETLEAIEGGLFCERLFGAIELSAPTKQARMRALESAYLRARDDEVLPPRPRMERFARITLSAPVPHPLSMATPWRERLARASLSDWPLEVLPVLPPDLRPIVPVQHGEGTRFVVSDLNDLYRNVIGANARVAKVRELGGPARIVELEVSRLSDAVAQLCFNPATPEPRTGPDGRPLMGLLEVMAHPSRPAWPALAELDGMVARGVVRQLSAPLAKRSLAVLAYLRALSIVVEIAAPGEEEPATVH